MSTHAYGIASMHILSQRYGGGWNVGCSEVGAGQKAQMVQSVYIRGHIHRQWRPPGCATLSRCSFIASCSGPERQAQEALRMLGALALVQQG